MKTLKVATAFSGGKLKKVIGFENEYLISENGEIFSMPRNGTINEIKKIKPSKSKAGYLRVVLSKNNKVYYKTVHRLVAENFVSGNKTLTVNHIDGNKINNNVENLEWISTGDNTRHAIKNGLTHRDSTKNPNFKKWYAIKPNGDVYRDENITLKEFCKKNKIHISTIIRNMKKGTALSKRSGILQGWRFYHA